MALAAVTLDDKYTRDRGRIFLSGIQALVRLPLLQRRRDLAAGLNTAGLVSGYRGSPLGGLDKAMGVAEALLREHHVRFQPGLNEDLAATALWGSQQVNLYRGARYDGVFGLWYGKGPGVDRTGDVFKHANAAGTSRFGGVLAVAGDDHNCKSSTLPHQSEPMFIGAMMPVLHPANVQEILDYGLYGWALSRFAGLWVGLKVIADTADSAASIEVDPARPEIILPKEFQAPPDGLQIRWPEIPLDQERRLHHDKIAAVHAFHRANGLDRVTLDPPRPRIGIIATGKAYLDLRQALSDLGIDDAMAADLGLRIYKVALSWPLEPEGALRFAQGLEEILVIEEKRPLIEDQLKQQLYDASLTPRPSIFGKRDEQGRELIPSTGELTPTLLARVLAKRLPAMRPSETVRVRLAVLDAKVLERAAQTTPVARIPYYCAGCPHNRSTKVPDGSRAIAGIGCHYMATWMDRNTETYTQMGGEGVPWIGQAPFTDETHVFANLGDGTYQHSGILAIRAALAAGVNITFKLLYNDAVAMTGGQPIEGGLPIDRLTRQLAAEGVTTIRLVADDPQKYGSGSIFAPGVKIHRRDELERVQRELRKTPGTSVLIYDQICATEKRRRQKRGRVATSDQRVVINELVCEGCGDCSSQSNCLAIEPLETEFGRKRHINQSSCNQDFSCVDGFCPSFVTVRNARLKQPAAAAFDAKDWPPLPEPVLPTLDQPYDILITGIGGTGIVTLAAILGMAAHLERKGVSTLDQTGLAQKYGAVTSHVRIAAEPGALQAIRIAEGQARLLLGADLIVSASPDALATLRRGRAFAVVNDHVSATADFTRDPDQRLPQQELKHLIEGAVGAGAHHFVDATKLGLALTGDAMAANVFLLGVAYQLGQLPLGRDAIERAIELNDTAVELNHRAFAWGRRAAVDPARLETLVGREPRPAISLDDIVAQRIAFLTAYQDASYAENYRSTIEQVRAVERRFCPGRDDLATTVARNLFTLMAYKDEYEVARLYTEGSFLDMLASQFEPGYRLEFHLAPPWFAPRDPETGAPRKRRFGAWLLPAFALLAKLRWLRGTSFDPFGHGRDRQLERRLIGDYRARLDELLAGLTADNHHFAVEIAALPARIRGFGHVKERHLREVEALQAELLAAFRQPVPQAIAAAAAAE